MFNTIILIDDDVATNYYNKYIIESENAAKDILIANNVDAAAILLEQVIAKDEDQFAPSLILLDVNMPKYSGFEFIDKYPELFGQMSQKGFTTYMLSTSENPTDLSKSEENEYISGYFRKPLKEGYLGELMGDSCLFSNNVK